MTAIAAPDWRRMLPGLGLVAALAATAFGLRQLLPTLPISVLMLAILLGALWRNLIGLPDWARPGVVGSMKAPLRLGIVLLGAQLTVGQLLSIGFGGVLLLIGCVVLTFAFTIWLGERLGVERGLAYLIAAGTSICGASAVVAANSVVQSRGEAVAYALGVVTLCGTVVMLGFPLLGAAADLSARAYGVWVGASVHEVPQVVAAAFAFGSEAGQYGTASKLTRVLMLAPMILWLGRHYARRDGAAAAAVPLPWFAFGFILMVGIASTGWLPPVVSQLLAVASQLLLALALAAVGLETDLRTIRAEGWRPLALGVAATLLIGMIGFAASSWLYD